MDRIVFHYTHFLTLIILSNFYLPLASAWVKQTLMMVAKMDMAMMYVRNFGNNKNGLAEAIFEKKMFKSCLEITKNICQYVATKVK